MMLLAALLQTAPLPPAVWKERNRPDMPRLPQCSFDNAVAQANTLDELPAGVVAEMRRFFAGAGPSPGIADAGGRYNGTDVIDSDAPSRRFLRAYLIGKRWILWYERRGLPQTIALRADTARGPTTWRMMSGTTLSGDLCRASDALAAGVTSGNP